MITPESPDWMRPLGETGIEVCAVTVGGGQIAGLPGPAGDEDGSGPAVDLAAAILRSPFRTLDTSNGYGAGAGERRIGAAIRRLGGLPAGHLVITKTDPLDGDYSGDRVRASVAESTERLGIDRLPLVHLHDPEKHDYELITAPGGALDALVELRETGVVDRIGLAGGNSRVMRRYLEFGVFDVLLVHNRWTLLDRSAEALIADARSAGIPLINAAILGGGLLGAPDRVTTYAYRPARPEVIAAARAMSEVAARYGTDLTTVALQASLRDPVVTTTVVGMSRPERLDGLLAAAAAELPDSLFDEVEALRPAPELWIDAA